MGIDAKRIGRLSLWQYQAMFDGWQNSQKTKEETEPPTYEEFKRFMDAPPLGARPN